MKTAEEYLKERGIKDTLYDNGKWIGEGLSKLMEAYARQRDTETKRERTCYTCIINPAMCTKKYNECSGKDYALWQPKEEGKGAEEMLKKFHKYLVNWVVGYNPSDEFINELIKEFIKEYASLPAKQSVTDEDIEREANKYLVSDEVVREWWILGAKAMRDGQIPKK